MSAAQCGPEGVVVLAQAAEAIVQARTEAVDAFTDIHDDTARAIGDEAGAADVGLGNGFAGPDHGIAEARGGITGVGDDLLDGRRVVGDIATAIAAIATVVAAAIIAVTAIASVVAAVVIAHIGAVPWPAIHGLRLR